MKDGMVDKNQHLCKMMCAPLFCAKRQSYLPILLCILTVLSAGTYLFRNATAAAAALLATSSVSSGSGNVVRITSTTNNNNNNAAVSAPPTPPKTIPSKVIGRDIHGLPVSMPLVGAGTWQYNDTVVYDSLCKAFQAGYTMVDTAFGYKNQKGVGRAIRDCYQGRREDLFVLTKIPGGLSHAETLAAHQHNMWELELEYVDHLMTHYPADWEQSPDRSSAVRRQEEWLALEEIYYTGKARTIGVSHYCARHLQDVLEMATIPPSLNQVEYHVGSGDVDDVLQACHENNVTFMSFSPLCGPCQYEPKDSLVHGDLVTEIASHYPNVTASQVSLRYIVQQALSGGGSAMGGVIPKSNNMDHLVENLNIFSFSLSQKDMDRLAAATKPPPEKGDCSVP